MDFLGSRITIDMGRVASLFAHGNAEKHRESLYTLRDEVMNAAQPSQAHMRCKVVPAEGDRYDLCGTLVSGPLVRFCFSGVDVAYPFVFTLGSGIDELIRSKDSPFEMYIADMMANVLLRSVKEAFELHLRTTYGHSLLSKITPGSVSIWPIESQRPLFSLLSGAGTLLPATLSDTCIMDPLKSVSGIYYPSDTIFATCMICTRNGCIGREYPYNAELEAEIVE